MAVPYETFEAALGRPVDSAEVRRVIDALGGSYVVRPITQNTAGYDPDLSRTVAWDFPSAPRANRSVATHLGVRDDTVVWMTLAPSLVDGSISDQAVSFMARDDTNEIFRPSGDEWHWAPAIVKRGDVYLLDLDVPQGHWDGNYKFPLTPRQAEKLRTDLLTYREVWGKLVRICQSQPFFDDPATLPARAQSVINARCGRD